MAELPRRESMSGIKEIGGFELLEKIGQGGMGSVFRARQKSLDRIVALKVLPPSIAKDAKFIERFQREARASAKLNHPNIVQGIDVGQDEATGLWYFAMELVDGPSLLTVLKEQGVLPEERVLQIGMDMARALDAAAQQGIVHRDIKPDNILIASNGTAKLADLGLAKQTKEDASLTQDGTAMGTPFYMAPEQIRGQLDQIDQRTDLYALGGTLFHLVTGQKPFTGETGAVIMTKHLTEVAPRANKVNPLVSDGFARLIARMLQKKREQRIQSGKELLAALEKIASGDVRPVMERSLRQSGGARMPISARTPTVPAQKSQTMAIAAGVAVGVVIVGMVGILLLRGNSEPPNPKVAAGNEPDATATLPVAPVQHAAAPVNDTPKEPDEPVVPASHAVEKSVETSDPPPPIVPALPEVADTKAVRTPAETAIVPALPVQTPAAEPAERPAVEPGKPLEEKPSEPPPPKTAEWPLAEMLADLQANAPEKALTRVGNGNYLSKDDMVAALKGLVLRGEARRAALTRLVGQNVKLDSVKGPQNGKLLSFEDNVLKIERTYVINGRSQASTVISVPLDELTPAALERLVPTPAPAAASDWIGAILVAMATGKTETAEKALPNIEGHALHDLLAEELKRTRVQEREAKARDAWEQLVARADEANTQTRAKQFVADLEAFGAAFKDADLLATPEVVAKLAGLKEKFERLALGLDPRVVKLFKGRVLNYDARTQVITLGYDFSTKEQTEDFVDSTWAPPGDHTGLTWKKGELRTFCKGTADRIMQMPQFLSGTLTLTFDFRRIDTSKRNRFEVEFGFYGLASEGKTLKVSYWATEKGYFLRSTKGNLKTDDAQVPFRTDGTLELSCQGQAISVKENGKSIFEYQLPKANDHVGFWLGGGWDSGITFTKLQVSGRLDPGWLTQALGSAPKTR